VISAGIHMSDIPTFPYELLWGERSMSSVANLTRQDGHEFMEIASRFPLNLQVTSYPLEEVNLALQAIRDGSLVGSAVLKIK
jgi:alcohol dehydrogenase, propanol-preferring